MQSLGSVKLSVAYLLTSRWNVLAHDPTGASYRTGDLEEMSMLFGEEGNWPPSIMQAPSEDERLGFILDTS
jgi:hypothetical protein